MSVTVLRCPNCRQRHAHLEGCRGIQSPLPLSASVVERAANVLADYQWTGRPDDYYVCAREMLLAAQRERRKQ